MRHLTRVAFLAGLVSLLGAGGAGAHHGWSGYDSSKELTLTGTITEAGYEHPHGSVRLETPGKTWVVVLAPPSRMENRGLKREMLKGGVLKEMKRRAYYEKPSVKRKRKRAEAQRKRRKAAARHARATGD